MSSPTSAVAANLKPDIKPEEHFAQLLSKVLKGVTCPIATGGFLELESAPTLITKDGGEFTISPVIEDNKKDGWGDQGRANRLQRQVASLQSLIEDIPQAAFGDGSETKVDASVRDAMQLPAESFIFDCIPSNKMDEILVKIKKDLALETDIVVEPYSLNVYQKEGRFVKHKDTPRGDGMLGTLVICLPSLFTGGNLDVTMGNEKHTYFAQKKFGYAGMQGGSNSWWNSPAAEGAKTLPWAAFFADVDHEIMTVEGGLRITISYLIRRKDALSATTCLPREVQADEQATIIKEEMGKVLHDEQFLTEGGKLGYPCLHLYTNTQVFPAGKTSNDPLTPKQISKLKGRDLMVANAAASFGLALFLVPYLSHKCQGDFGDFRLQKFPQKKRCPRYMSENDVGRFFEGERNDDYERPEEHADVWLLQYGDSEQPKNKVGETDNYNYEGYYGNEASYTEFYVKAALFIQVPSYTETRGDEVKGPPSKKRKAVAK